MRFIAVLVFGVMLATADGARAYSIQMPPAPESGWLGIDLQDLTKQDADALGWQEPHGAKVAKAAPGGPTEAAGMQVGDVLVTLDGVEIKNVEAFGKEVSKMAPGTAVKLRLLRNGQTADVTVRLAVRPAVEEAAIPMLDAGGHMAQIMDIAFTPDGRQIVSASQDKTIRVWDVATGKTVRTIRGEAAVGPVGKIYAMALSPDGKWLAVGGLFHPRNPTTGAAIRLYDSATGKLVARLTGHENVICDLAFSPDSRHLISGSQDNTAIIWDVAAAAHVTPGSTIPPLHQLRGHKDHIYAVGFTRDGLRAVTGSFDHEVRLWQVADGAEIARMPGHGNKIMSFAAAPDGTIATGDESGEIRLWDGATGAFRKVLAQQGTDVDSLSFSPDGKLLLSSCGQDCGDTNVFVYDVASGRKTITYRGHDSVVLATAISPDGRWAATGGGKGSEIHIWDLNTGEQHKGADGHPLTFGAQGRPVHAVGFSADGRYIGWGNSVRSGGTINDKAPLEHALALPSGDVPLAGPVSIGDGTFIRAVTELQGWSLEHRKGGDYGYDSATLDIKQGGRVVASIERGGPDGYRHSAYTFTPDGETIISGGADGVLTAYNREGRELGNFIGHEGDVWGVATSPDGRLLVSGAVDQTLRLWNLKTRELLVTLFRSTDGDWVMWTPQGYYAASNSGAERIGWQINHGPENAADYITAAQLRKSLHRPDIVAKAIQLASAKEAVQQSPDANFTPSDLLKQRPAQAGD